MRRVRWALATRLLVRDWRAGENAVLVAALVVAVAAMSAEAIFTDRVMQAVTQQAGEVLAADLRLESNYPLSESYLSRAEAVVLRTERVVQFRSVKLAKS